MKKVIIVGKGPTVEKIGKIEGVSVAALNDAIRFCTHVDYFFFNDFDALERNLDQLDKVKLAIFPSYPHIDLYPSADFTYEKVIPYLNGVNYDIYELRTAKKKGLFKSFGHIQSVGETAVAWCLNVGYSEFVFNGVGSNPGYNESFEGTYSDKKNSWFKGNFDRIQNRLKKSKANFSFWNIDRVTEKLHII